MVFAVKLERFDTMGGPQYSEEMGAFFHERCFPHGSTQYRRKPKPDAS